MSDEMTDDHAKRVVSALADHYDRLGEFKVAHYIRLAAPPTTVNAVAELLAVMMQFAADHAHEVRKPRWLEVGTRPPTREQGVQVKVLFCKPGWPGPVVGMYELRADGSHAWAEYDAQADRYIEWPGPMPTLWTPLLAPPPEATS